MEPEGLAACAQCHVWRACLHAQVHVAFNGTAYNELGLPCLPVEPVQFWRLPSAEEPSMPADLSVMAPMPIHMALP